jgi:cold shock CspA family protein
MKGIVKFYSLVKGAGVIVGEDRKEYTFKMADITGAGLRRLSENQAITFIPVDFKATQVAAEGENK